MTRHRRTPGAALQPAAALLAAAGRTAALLASLALATSRAAAQATPLPGAAVRRHAPAAEGARTPGASTPGAQASVAGAIVSGDAALDSLVARAARRTASYADRAAAIADGYRRIGPDFPGMGEHWLHPGALLAGTLDPARPTLLAYAAVAGRPTLLGVGFVVTSRGAEEPDVPGWPWAWHEHSGLLADESGAHASTPIAGDAPTRVWVLHAWTALANPAGPHAPDNWALPFARLGVAVAAAPDADAGRAASLLTGGDAYLRALLDDAGLLDGAHAPMTDAALVRARDDARRTLAGVRDARLGPAERDSLRAVWRTLAVSLRVALGERVEPLLAPPHAAHETAAAPATRAGAHDHRGHGADPAPPRRGAHP